MQNITITYIGNHWTMKIKRGIGSDCSFIFQVFTVTLFLDSVLKTSLFLKHLHFLSIKIVHCSVFQYKMITSAIKRVKVDWIQNKMRQNTVSLVREMWDISKWSVHISINDLWNILGIEITISDNISIYSKVIQDSKQIFCLIGLTSSMIFS